MKSEGLPNPRHHDRSQPERDLDKYTTVHLTFEFDESDLKQALRYEDSPSKNPMVCNKPACGLSRWNGKDCYLHGLVKKNKVKKGD